MTGARGRPSASIDVAILGATGTVGQRFVQLLENHPWFRVTSVVASPRSAGRPYGEVCDWRLEGEIPAAVRGLDVTSATASPAQGVQLALSALDSSVAGETESRYADAGILVVSNAAPHRMSPSVPLVVPEVNADHLALVSSQGRPGAGGIVCNPNCSTIGIVLALAPLQRAFGLDSVLVTTLQAASGAGYPGVSALDLIDNVVPFIRGEEDKLTEEPAKILGALRGEAIEPLAFDVSAQCFRVPVVDGHTASVAVALRQTATFDGILDAWSSFGSGSPSSPHADVPSSIPSPVLYTHREDRPQPRLDRSLAGGLGITVGRLRPCTVQGWRFVVLSHNTIRGAAGGAILVAEHCVARGLLGEALSQGPDVAPD